MRVKPIKWPYPGGDFANLPLHEYIENLQQHHLWLSNSLATRLVHSYGTQTASLLDNCIAYSDLGQMFAPDFYQREIDYLIQTRMGAVQHRLTLASN